MVLVLGIVKASLEILGIGIGVKKVVLLMSVVKASAKFIYYSLAISYPEIQQFNAWDYNGEYTPFFKGVSGFLRVWDIKHP